MGLFFPVLTVSLLQSSGEAYFWLSQTLRCRPHQMLTFRCDPCYWIDKTPPTFDAFENTVKRILRNYGRSTGDRIPLAGVTSPTKHTDWPHIHSAFQHHTGTDEQPVADLDKLKTVALGNHIIVTLSIRPNRDLLHYITRHMLRNGARCIAGSGLRTDFSKTDAERKLIADDRDRARARRKREPARDDRAWLAQDDRAPRDAPRVKTREPLQLLRKGAARLVERMNVRLTSRA